MTVSTKTLADLQAGDDVAERPAWGSNAPSIRRKVVKRTPKTLFLDDGSKVHTESSGDKYSPWSDEKEAELTRRREWWAAQRDLQSFNMQYLSNGGGSLTPEKILANPEAFAELKELVKKFQQEQKEILAKFGA